MNAPSTSAVRALQPALCLAAAVAAAACGSSVLPSLQPISSGSGATPTAAAQGATGGVADTPSNPDRTYVCADASQNAAGKTIAYVTVAGSDTAAAQSECSTLTQGSAWTTVSTSPYHETQYTPVCFITFDSGHATTRVYTADNVAFATGTRLCDAILTQHGVPTLPP